MTDFNLVLSFVTLDASNDQLDNLLEAIKLRRANIARKAKNTIRVGQNVTFNHKGIDYSGVVKAIKIKKATVECVNPNARSYVAKMPRVLIGSTYNVPLNMLKAA